MYQEQFTQLYDRLLRYAHYKASRYFRDEVLRQDAADKAMNDAVDTWVTEGCYDEEVAKRAIQSSLRQSSRKREVEPVSSEGEEYDGMHSYKII